MFVAEYHVMVGDVLIHPKDKDYTVKLPNVGSKNAAIKRINEMVLPHGTVKCNIYEAIDIDNKDTYELVQILVPIADREKWKWE